MDGILETAADANAYSSLVYISGTDYFHYQLFFVSLNISFEQEQSNYL